MIFALIFIAVFAGLDIYMICNTAKLLKDPAQSDKKKKVYKGAIIVGSIALVIAIGIAIAAIV